MMRVDQLLNPIENEEQEEWLSSVIAFQGQVAKHLSLQRLQKEMKQNKEKIFEAFHFCPRRTKGNKETN